MLATKGLLTLFLVIAVAGAMLVPTQSAAVILLDSSGSTVFQQTTNNPCVIGDPSCKQPADFDYNKQPGTPDNISSGVYDLFSHDDKTATAAAPFYVANGSVVGNPSPAYDQIPSSFTIGIDVNYAAGQDFETLVFFKTWDCGVGGVGPCVLDANNSFAASTSDLVQHNGNGFSDALLTGFSLISGHVYDFEVRFSSDTDGMEEFFIIPGTSTPIPEPASLLLVGSGLVGLGSVVRRRWHSRSSGTR